MRHAEKEGVTVKQTHIDNELVEWIRSYAAAHSLERGMRLELSNLPQVIVLLRRLDEIGDLRVYVGRSSTGEIVATEIFLASEDGRDAYRFLAFVPETGRQLQAGVYALDQALEHLSEANVSSVHLMAGNVKELSDYVRQFSPMLVPYYTVSVSRFSSIKKGLRVLPLARLL